MNWICTLCDVFVCKNLLLITVLCAFGDDASVWIIILWTIAYRLETVLATYGRCRRERIKKKIKFHKRKKKHHTFMHTALPLTLDTHTQYAMRCVRAIYSIYTYSGQPNLTDRSEYLSCIFRTYLQPILHHLFDFHFDSVGKTLNSHKCEHTIYNYTSTLPTKTFDIDGDCMDWLTIF